MTITGPSTNAPCVFPFTFNNVTYHECVLDIDGAWCSTEVANDGVHVSGQGKWGICGQGCPIPSPSGTLRITNKVPPVVWSYLFIKCFYNIYTHYIFISKECITVSGPSKNVSCIFPFTYNHVTYHECILDLDGAWCSTEVDDDGMHVGGQGKWGICGAECPIPPSGISSRMYIFLPWNTVFVIS